MFEALAIRQRSGALPTAPFDVGLLAEALVFYSEVTLIANRSVFETLLDYCPADVLAELLESRFLRLAYEEQDVAVITTDAGTANETHDPITWSMPDLELQRFLPSLLATRIGKSGKARRLSNRLARHIERIHHQQSLADAARDDLLNENYVTGSVQTLLARYVPSYPRDRAYFRTIPSGKKLAVETNIDFAQANLEYHTHIPATHSSLNSAYLLAHLVNVRADLHFAARYASEMALDSVPALIIREQLGQLLSAREHSGRNIERFQEFVYGDGRAIGEAIRSKERNFADLLPILERSRKFKEWLKGRAAQSDLVREYFREVTQETWTDRLPVKGVRWFLFTAGGLGLDLAGAGGLGTAAGVGLSAFDAFIMDKLLSGWKPNQFVSQHLASFVAGTGPTNRG